MYLVNVSSRQSKSKIGRKNKITRKKWARRNWSKKYIIGLGEVNVFKLPKTQKLSPRTSNKQRIEIKNPKSQNE